MVDGNSRGESSMDQGGQGGPTWPDTNPASGNLASIKPSRHHFTPRWPHLWIIFLIPSWSTTLTYLPGNVFRAPAVIEIPHYKEICRSCKSLKQKSSEIFSLAHPAPEYKLLQIYRMKIGEIHLIKIFHFSLPAAWTRMWLSRNGLEKSGLCN